ncbi:short-chain dehydrogenase/reductase SDR [Leptolyngbya sp. NIES-3755]|nr:short-chain dehydrogenase/reductase SDR [Leptolyngbya sp. NIES-3755]
MRLTEKVALITGAGSGIGRESALLFAKEGAKVIVCDVNETGGKETVDRILAAKGEAIFVKADVSKSGEVKSAIDTAESTYGKLNVLFNNAGIFHGADNSVLDTEEDVWELTMNINLKGVFLGCKYGIPALQRAGGGSIINTASFVAVMGAATPQIAYTASKGGVLAMTREIAVEFARQNIRANSLCPGPVQTPLLDELMSDPARKQRRMVHIPSGRLAQATEIAQAALFLASDESSYVNGSTFLVDGGISSAYVTPE